MKYWPAMNLLQYARIDLEFYGVSLALNAADYKNFSAQANEWIIGETVPWSVAWTDEQSFELQLSDDFPGLVDLVQVQRPGKGTPKFATQHVTRHRLGMGHHLCHVCGKRTLKGDRYIFPVQTGGFVTMPDESTRYAGNVPPVHLACANRGQRLCPHLSHTLAKPVVFPAEESRLMPRPDIVEGMEELSKTLPPELRIVYSCYRLYGPRFSKHVKNLRQQNTQPFAE